MDYRHSQYDCGGPYDAAPSYRHPVQDAYDRSSKRRRSHSPDVYSQRAAADPWDRPRDSTAAYDDYREPDRAAEWDRYYREQDMRSNAYDYPDRQRYESRARYDEEYSGDASSTRRASRDGRYPVYDADSRRNRPVDSTTSAPDPMQSDSLLSFRAYAQMTRATRDRTAEHLTNNELYESYQNYKTVYNRKVVANFFEQRKTEEWFKEKYSMQPAYLTARLERKRMGRAGKKQIWLDELQQGKLDRVNYDMQPRELEESSSMPSRPRSDSHETYDSHRHGDAGTVVVLSRYGEREVLASELAQVPPCPHQVLIKSYPANGSRAKLESVLQTKPGFQYLAMGEPHVGKRWCRAGWAMYDPETDMDELLNTLQGTQIDGFTLNLASCAKPATSKLRTVPEYANSFARLSADLKHCQQLVSRLEAEDRDLLSDSTTTTLLETSASDAIMDRHRQLESDLLEEDLEKGFDPAEPQERREQRRSWLKKHLDLHLDLLRHVYNCDYYLSLVCEFGEELVRRSPCHARRQPAAGADVPEEPRESSNDESWARSVDQKTALLLLAPDATTELVAEHGGKSGDAVLMTAALAYVKQEEAEKHRCTVELPRPPTDGDGSGVQQCGKLFKAVNFVQKHVLNKHRSVLLSQSGLQEALDEVELFNNYVRDASRATAQPSDHLASAAMPPPQTAGGVYDGGARMGSIRFPAPVPINGQTNSAAPPAGVSLGMRLGAVITDEPNPNSSLTAAAAAGAAAAPLPPPPKPLDPRASRPTAHYQDLDTAAEGDVLELAY